MPRQLRYRTSVECVLHNGLPVRQCARAFVCGNDKDCGHGQSYQLLADAPFWQSSDEQLFGANTMPTIWQWLQPLKSASHLGNIVRLAMTNATHFTVHGYNLSPGLLLFPAWKSG